MLRNLIILATLLCLPAKHCWCGDPITIDGLFDDWTPVLLTSFQCEHLATGVRLDWEISVGSPDFDLRLLRSGLLAPGSRAR